MATIDLNVMQAFVAVYNAGSVSAAAVDLHVSQPTVTHSLNRLRDMLGDQLFLRSRHGVVPTATAHRIYPDVVKALNLLASALNTATTFDPDRAGLRFRVAMSDAGEISILPQIYAALTQEAPRVGVDVLALNIEQAEAQLLRGEIDAFMSSATFNSRRISVQTLFHEPYVLIHRAGRSGVEPGISSTDLAGLRHIVVQGVTGHERPASLLESIGATDTTVVPRFTALPQLVAGNEAVAIIPQYVADAFKAAYPIDYVDVSHHVDPIAISMFTRQPHYRNAAQAWFIDFVTSHVERPGAGSPQGSET